MTPKEKAEELVDTFNTVLSLKLECLLCAEICVNEIIKSIPTQPNSSEMERIDAITFWMQVREEILTYGGNK